MRFCYICGKVTHHFDCMSCEEFRCDFCKGRAILEGEYHHVPIKSCAECSKVIKALNEWNEKHKDNESKPEAMVQFEKKMMDVQGNRLKLYNSDSALEVKGIELISRPKSLSLRSVSFESLRTFISDKIYLPISHKFSWEKID